MSNSKIILDQVREFVAYGGSIDEHRDVLLLHGRMPSAGAQVRWLALAAESQPKFETQLYDPVIGGDLDEEDEFSETRKINITLRKPEFPNAALFFFQSEMIRMLKEKCIPEILLATDLNEFQSFATRGFRVGCWHLDDGIFLAEEHVAIDASKYVRDFTQAREVPLDVSPWLLKTAPLAHSSFYNEWKIISSRRLLSSLVSSVWEQENKIFLQASGPPIYRIEATDPSIADAWANSTACVDWVYLSGTDIEVRHLLFAAELARAHRIGQSINDVLETALEAVRITYESHLQSSSRETLKALSELRKTVIDEAQKVTQKAQEFTAGLWKDVAVASAPFVLKALSDQTSTLSGHILWLLYLVSALVISTSFALQWYINKAFFRSQKMSRRRWMQALYNHISIREREEIADKPIEVALTNYRRTRGVLSLVYIALVAALLFACFKSFPYSLQDVSLLLVGVDNGTSIMPSKR